MVIRGKAASPVYLYLEKERVAIKDAKEIWGRDVWEVMDYFKQEYPGCEAALIGPAGENLVRYACVQNGYFDAWGRTGLGAVMGSKKLKAIVVKGEKRLRPCEPEKMASIAAVARERIYSSPFYQPFKRSGTMGAMLPYGRFGALNAHNFTRGCLEDWKDKVSYDRIEGYLSRRIACQNCMIACGHLVRVSEGEYAGLTVKAMEITPTVSFASGCGMSLEGTFKASELCYRLGMDMVSTAGVIGMAIELFREGRIKEKELGSSIDFGDDKAILNLIQNIAYRRGIGDLLAEGTARVALELEGASRYAMQVRGLELPMIDPRGRWSTWTLGMLTNPRGGDHLRCRSPVENLRFNEYSYGYEPFGFDRRVYEELDMPEDIKRRAIDLEKDLVNIPVMAKWSEDLINLFNAVGICIRPPVLNAIGPSLIAEALGAFNGITLEPEEVVKAGERSFTLMRLFNLREGDKAEPSFPRRFYTEELNGRRLEEEAVRNLLMEYYKERGWNDKGIPEERKLEELGLGKVLYGAS